MSQAIITYTDFATASTADQIQGMLYKGQGFPIGVVSSLTAGALYLDSLSGTLWTATAANSTTAWKTFYSQNLPGSTIDTDIQEGDFVALLGGATFSTSGNLNFTRYNHLSAGSQNATIITLGNSTVTSSGAISTITSSELYNGATWVSASNMILSNSSAATGAAVALGSQFATFIPQNTLSISHLFNGSVWSTTGVSINLSGGPYNASVGTSNAALETGTATVWFWNGNTWFTQVIGSAGFSLNATGSINNSTYWGNNGVVTQTFNGSTFLNGTVLPVSNPSLASNGYGSAFAATSLYTPSSGPSQQLIYNSCTWATGGSEVLNVFGLGAGGGVSGAAGSQNAGIISGGYVVAASGPTNGTQQANQKVYRRLTFTNAPTATNIGIAIGTSNANLSANIVYGDVSNLRLPGNNFFGLSPISSQENTRIYLENARTPTAVSITINGDGTCTTVLSSGTNICKGLLLEVSGYVGSLTVNNGFFPVTNFSGTTSITFKNPNAVASVTTTSNFRLCWGNRLSGLTSASITVSGNVGTVTFASVGNLSTTTFAQLVKVGGVIYIPYASASGAAGSALNYGTYRITAVSTSGGAGSSPTISFTSQNTYALTETISCNTIEYWSQAFVESSNIGPSFYRLGYNGKMRLTSKPICDDATNGIM